MQVLDEGEVAEAAEADPGLLDLGAVARHGGDAQVDVDPLLVDVGALGVREDDVAPAVGVADGGTLDAGGAHHDVDVLVEHALLVGEGDGAGVHAEHGRDVVDDRRHLGELDALAADGAGLLDGEAHLGVEVAQVVEGGEAPAAAGEGPDVAAEAAAPADLLEVASAVADGAGVGLLDADLDVLGVDAFEGCLDPLAHLLVHVLPPWVGAAPTLESNEWPRPLATRAGRAGADHPPRTRSC